MKWVVKIVPKHQQSELLSSKALLWRCLGVCLIEESYTVWEHMKKVEYDFWSSPGIDKYGKGGGSMENHLRFQTVACNSQKLISEIAIINFLHIWSRQLNFFSIKWTGQSHSNTCSYYNWLTQLWFTLWYKKKSAITGHVSSFLCISICDKVGWDVKHRLTKKSTEMSGNVSLEKHEIFGMENV